MVLGLLAPVGGNSAQPSPPESEVFATVFGSPPPLPVIAVDPLSMAEGPGGDAFWAVVIPVLGGHFPKVDAPALSDCSGVQLVAASVESGGLRLGVGENVPRPIPPSVVPPAAKGGAGSTAAHAVASRSEGAVAMPDSSLVPGQGDRWTNPSASAPSSLPDGPVPLGGVTDGKTDRLPPNAPIAHNASTMGAVDLAAVDPKPSKRLQAAEMPLSRLPQGVTPAFPTHAHGFGGAESVPTFPVVTATHVDRPTVPAVPAAPVFGEATPFSAAATDAPVSHDAVPSDPGHERTAGPIAEDLLVNADLAAPPSGRPSSTEAERVWLGRLHWHNVLAGGIETNVSRDTPPPYGRHHRSAQAPRRA